MNTTDQKVNPISFRVPPNLKGKAHDDVVKTIIDHDNGIVDLRKANKSLKEQLAAMQDQIKALQGGK